MSLVEKNKEIVKKMNIRKWYVEYKSDKKCSKCPENDPICLDFHHIKPMAKTKTVSKMVSEGMDVKVILLEIEKCEILCANCHRKTHKFMIF
jgi:hypothetical protein